MKDRSLFTTTDGYSIAYRLDGPAIGPVLVLANSIGTTFHMWDGQIQALSKHFRVLRYDMRGHGGSDVPAGEYSVERLGHDVIELLDLLQINQAHFCGLSFGGIVAQWLGIYASERIKRLVLCNTSAYLGPARQWDLRIASVLQAKDMTETAEMFLKNWFPSSMLEGKHAIVEEFRTVLLGMSPQGFAGSYAAIRDTDMRPCLARIQLPTLVIAGQYDTVTHPSHSELIAESIPGSKLLLLPAVHLSNIEYPVEFLDAVLTFLLSA